MRCDALLEQWFRPNSNYINSLANTMSPSTIKSLSTTLSTVDKAPGPGLLHPLPNQNWSMVKGCSAH